MTVTFCTHQPYDDIFSFKPTRACFDQLRISYPDRWRHTMRGRDRAGYPVKPKFHLARNDTTRYLDRYFGTGKSGDVLCRAAWRNVHVTTCVTRAMDECGVHSLAANSGAIFVINDSFIAFDSYIMLKSLLFCCRRKTYSKFRVKVI